MKACTECRKSTEFLITNFTLSKEFPFFFIVYHLPRVVKEDFCWVVVY